MKKRLLSLMMALAIILAAAGCSPKTETTAPETPQQTASEPQTVPETKEETKTPATGTIVFKDSAERDVEIPANIKRIAPSGPLATVVLYTLCPDKIVGYGSELSDGQKALMDEKYHNLPVFGNFYADTLNLEAVMTAEPQVVIDIGEAKPSVKEDMEGVQEKTGIPSLFVHMDLTDMATAYRTLGKIVGEEEQGEKLAQYVEKTLAEAKEKSASIAEGDKVKLYYGQGDAGLTALVKGTVHSDVIDIIGAANVTNVAESVRGGASDISMEQLMVWQPNAIIFGPGSIYKDVLERDEWKEVKAVQDKKVYEVPVGIYNWMGRPPSVNRVIGIKWLGNLLYPEVYNYDMIKETQEFYNLFYHVDLTEAQVKDLLKNSTFQQ